VNRIALFLTLALPLAAASNDSFLLRNVTVHPVAGPEIANGSILVEDGRIVDVGVRVAAPKAVRIMDGRGMHAYPGMIDSATEIGLSEIGAIRETNDATELGQFDPQLRALVAINPESEHITVTPANGITSVITLPAATTGGRGNTPPPVITGQAAMIHLDGWTWEDMAVERTAAMQLIFPTVQIRVSRFGAGGGQDAGPTIPYSEARGTYEEHIRQLTDFFENSRRYQTAKAARVPGFKSGLKYEAMIPVLEGKTPVLVTAVRERAIRDAIRFGKQQKIRIILAEPREIAKVLPEIKSSGFPVITGPTLELPLGDDDSYDAAFTLPSELYKAGIKLAFGSFNNQFARNLPYQAGTAVAFGLPHDEALKAVTINAAEIWGVADRVGSIEKGKLADLMITDGDPLETKTQVKQLFIAGREVDLTNKQTRLYEKYMNRP
jgi:imidazolonepropionase-like amidohydrolase